MRCRGFGLTLATEVHVPGAVADRAEQAIDLEIVQGPAPAWTSRTEWGPYRADGPDLFDFSMEGVGRYTVVGRRRIIVTPEPGAEPTEVSDMLVATVLPALIWARGDVVLHASAAARHADGPGWLLLGRSGTGKSTRLKRALDRGASGVADDSVRVRIEDGQVVASGLAGGVFLRRPGDGPRTWVATPPERQMDEAVIRAAYVIEPSPAPARRMTRLETLAALLRHRHRPRILQLLQVEAEALVTLTRISGAIRMTAIGLRTNGQ